MPENRMIKVALERRKWMVLVAAIWIQAFTGTNFDFPSYSPQLKSVLGITQVQLNYLSMASDFGKLFGWCSGVLLLYFPAWIVLFMAAFLGLFGYGLQWLLIQRLISLPYFMVIDGPGYDLVLGSKRKLCDCWVFDKMIEPGRVMVLGEEHGVGLLVSRVDFWLYYVAYFCGGTIGLVYSNNLGQISQSFGFVSETKSLVTIFSTCSFFGRLVSAATDLTDTKRYIPRTGWLALWLAPMTVAFLVLVLSGSESGLRGATGLIGICSGFVFSAAVSITSELFGPKSSGINHNVLITNIPLGSLMYGVLGAVIYEHQINGSNEVVLVGGSKVCMGRECYNKTFGWWGFVSFVGLVSSFLLFLRTKAAYRDYYQRNSVSV